MKELTRYEKASIVGARSLQLAMGAPRMVETDSSDPMEIAEHELEEGTIPITVKK